jgi:Ala-tRNA(Pro) deacylase
VPIEGEQTMWIPARLSHFLESAGAHYDIRFHRHSRSSAETAHAAHVPPHLLAKPVVVEDEDGCLLALVPSDRFVMLGPLSQLLGRRHLRLADEERIAGLFPDCERGAVPAVGMPWGLEIVVDEELEAGERVYLECGDHEALLGMSGAQFHELMKAAPHGRFSGDRVH